ncbi:MAG: hypothetical protein AB8E74_01010 [Prochlorococcus sp.]|nr:hypothetical protein [Prochlorococcaceae cyanobacterium Fu_MAG_50]
MVAGLLEALLQGIATGIIPKGAAVGDGEQCDGEDDVRAAAVQDARTDSPLSEHADEEPAICGDPGLPVCLSARPGGME